MPGATAKGSLAYSPIRRVIRKQTRTVAVRTPEKGMPDGSVESMAGLTITM